MCFKIFDHLLSENKAQANHVDPEGTAPCLIRVFTVCYSDKHFMIRRPLFVLMIYVPVNNFSVKLGCFNVLLG